jgi:hypothetical protein
LGRGSEGSGLVEGGTGSVGTLVGSSIGSMEMVRRGSPMSMLEALLHHGVAVRRNSPASVNRTAEDKAEREYQLR